jgi:hypothetical protein
VYSAYMALETTAPYTHVPSLSSGSQQTTDYGNVSRLAQGVSQVFGAEATDAECEY